MPIIAKIVSCKKCGFEIRDDWHFCPNCGDKIVCPVQQKKELEQAKKK